MGKSIIPENWTGTVAENARLIDKYLDERFDLSNELNWLLANKESTSREWKAAIQYQQRCQQLYDEAVQAYNAARSACEAAINDPECDSAPYAAALNDAKEGLDRAAEQLTLANKEVNRLTLALSKLEEDINSKINAINSLEVPVGINNNSNGTFTIDTNGLQYYRDQYYEEWLGKFAEIHEHIREHMTTIDTIYGSIPKNTQLDMSGHIEYFQADNANINKIIGENRTYFRNYIQYLDICLGNYKDQVDDSLQEPILLDIYQLLFDSDIAERAKLGMENIDFGQLSIKSEDVKKGIFISQTDFNPELLKENLSFKISKDGTVEILSNGKKIGYTTVSNLVENAVVYEKPTVRNVQFKNPDSEDVIKCNGISEQQLREIYATVYAEGKEASPEDYAAVASVILNRTNSPQWSDRGNVYEQVISRKQFAGYGTGNRKFRNFMNGTVNPDTMQMVENAVNDIFTNGPTNPYLSFRSAGSTSYSNIQVVEGGNRYK